MGTALFLSSSSSSSSLFHTVMESCDVTHLAALHSPFYLCWEKKKKKMSEICKGIQQGQVDSLYGA